MADARLLLLREAVQAADGTLSMERCIQSQSGTSCASSGQKANPEALGGLDEDFAEQVLHARGLGFVEPPREGERDREGEGGGSEEHSVAVPVNAQPSAGVFADGVDQQPPGNGGEAEGDVAEGGVDGEEVVAARSEE